MRDPGNEVAYRKQDCESLVEKCNKREGRCPRKKGRRSANRTPFLLAQIGLLQQTITWYKIRHAGGQAHYYSHTGTLKQRDVNQSSETGLCFNVPVLGH